VKNILKSNRNHTLKYTKMIVLCFLRYSRDHADVSTLFYLDLNKLVDKIFYILIRYYREMVMFFIPLSFNKFVEK
jgi:hypothetical protein